MTKTVAQVCQKLCFNQYNFHFLLIFNSGLSPAALDWATLPLLTSFFSPFFLTYYCGSTAAQSNTQQTEAKLCSEPTVTEVSHEISLLLFYFNS